MARAEPGQPGIWWGRQAGIATNWVQISVIRSDDAFGGGLCFLWNGRWHLVSAFDWLGPAHPDDRRVNLPANATVKDTGWPRKLADETPTGALPVDGLRNPERFGGYASPRRQRVGEIEDSVGGLTVWDKYVLAFGPAIFTACPDGMMHGDIAQSVALFADAMLAEREKREGKSDET